MIHPIDQQHCCGCSACAQRCPQRCITMQADAEGFLYPCVNGEACVRCGRCIAVCPYLNAAAKSPVQETFAARAHDEQLLSTSSSGGMFSLLAARIIQQGGVVFGVRLDQDYNAVFDHTDALEGLSAFQGSKYLQAIPGQVFLTVERMLKQGRSVLFTGTSCQVRALRLFLQHDYDNLLAIDFICHGVPSPAVWQHYLHELTGHQPFSGTVNFRDKCKGWKKYHVSISGTTADGRSIKYSRFHKNDPYMRLFLANVLRPSCYNCPAKNGTSASDLTIADLWGVQKVAPDMADNKGTSLIIANTMKGRNALQGLPARIKTVHLDKVLRYNFSYSHSVPKPERRDEFMAHYAAQPSFEGYVNRLFPKLSPWVHFKVWVRELLLDMKERIEDYNQQPA